MSKKTRIILYISIAVVILAVGVVFILAKNANKPTEEISTIDYVDRGNKYLIALSYDKAAIEYTEAIRVDPMNAEAYIGLAEAYVGMDNMDKAIDTLELGYEKTGDERIRVMLEELVGETEETVIVTTKATSVTTVEDFSQDPTVDFYFPSKLTVYSKYHFNNNYCYHFGTTIHNKGYCFYVASDPNDEDSNWGKNEDIVVINDPYVHCNIDSDIYKVIVHDESYLDWSELSFSNLPLHNSDQNIFYIKSNFEKSTETINHSFKQILTNSMCYDYKEQELFSSDGIIAKGIYNDDGFLIEEENYEYNNKLFYTYDSEWNILQIQEFNIDKIEKYGDRAKPSEVISFEYENGKIIRINAEWSYQEYEYDSNGNNISITKYNFNEFEGKVTYKYDSVGNLINRTVYNSSNEIIENVDIEYTVLQISENCILPFEEEFGFKFNR